MTNKFNDIFLKSKTISESAERGYKVYTDKTNFQVVDASTVSEAMEKSGVKSPYKIEPAGMVSKSIFTKAEISEAAPKQPNIEQNQQPAPPETPAQNP